jgi:hypothetical protein
VVLRRLLLLPFLEVLRLCLSSFFALELLYSNTHCISIYKFLPSFLLSCLKVVPLQSATT